MKITESQNKRELYKEIRSKIESGELQTGEKLLSTKELAEKYGIAIQTAQRRLSELVSEGFLYRTTGKGTFVAGQKTIPRGGVVGLVMTCRGDIWGDFTATVSQKLQDAGINIIYVEADSNTESLLTMREHPAILQLLDANPTAIITRDSDFAIWLSNEFPDIQTICLSGDRINDFSGDIVCPDMYQAGYIGTKHLIDHGRKWVSFFKIKGPDVPKISKIRELDLLCDGYRQAIKEADLEENIIVDIADGLDDKRIYKEKLKTPKPIDAIFFNYDFRATEYIRETREMGISVPEDLAVVSLLNTPWADSFQLTSLDLRYDLIAEKCVQIILDSDKGEKKICSQIFKFKPDLVIRKSCGCNANR